MDNHGDCRQPLGSLLLGLGLITPAQLHHALAEQHGITLDGETRLRDWIRGVDGERQAS